MYLGAKATEWKIYITKCLHSKRSQIHKQSKPSGNKRRKSKASRGNKYKQDSMIMKTKTIKSMTPKVDPFEKINKIEKSLIEKNTNYQI